MTSAGGRRGDHRRIVEKRRDARVIGRTSAREVVVGEPAHGRRREEVAVAVLLDRGVPHAQVGHRVHEELEADRCRRTIGDDGGEVAPRRVTADGEHRAPQLTEMLPGPARGGRRVVDGGRERVLRGQAVADAEHAAPGPVGQRPARVVVAVEVAEHPSATVEPHEEAGGTDDLRPVEAARHAVGIDDARLGDRFRARAQQQRPLRTGVGRRRVLDRREVERLHHGEQLGGLAVQRHVPLCQLRP